MLNENLPGLQLYMKRLTMRSRLSETEKRAILDLPGHALQVKTNHDFVRLGEMTDHACLIVAGLAGRFCQTAEGARQITALHIAGDMADLQSVVQPRVGWALQALTTTTILRIPHSALRGVAARYPAVAEAFWRDCMVDAAVLSEWVFNLGRRDARTRIAHLFCETATRYRHGAQSHATVFEFPLTQTHLADATGLTTVHVNRMLKALSQVVKVTDGTVHIHDWVRLVEIGKFNSDYLQVDLRPADRIRIAERI